MSVLHDVAKVIGENERLTMLINYLDREAEHVLAREPSNTAARTFRSMIKAGREQIVRDNAAVPN